MTSSARDGEQAGRSLSTGLDGWLQTIRDSGIDTAQLAARYLLPEGYIAAVLAEPALAAEPSNSDATAPGFDGK